MNEAIIGIDLNEEEILTYEITDEALEVAACAGPENARVYTVAMCTGGVECPF
jgi:hypothetical protein